MGPHLFFFLSSGTVDDGGVSTARALRPVINIRSDVTVSGLGTMTSPYTFSLNLELKKGKGNNQT